MRSLNHLIRPKKHRLRNRDTNLLGCFEIDHQLKLCRLLDRQIRGLGTFQNLIHVRRGTPRQIGSARPIHYESAGFRKPAGSVNCRELDLGNLFDRLRRDSRAVRYEYRDPVD